MRRVIVHIGMHKTGSSSIQATLASGPGDPRFRYLDLGTPNHSEPVYSLFATDPENYFIHRARGRRGPAVERFNAAVRRRMTRQLQRDLPVTWIISGEDIVLLDEPGLQRLRAFLLQFFGELTVVGYVRPPVAFLQSAFQQRLKGPGGELDLMGCWPDYHPRFEKFDRVFGRANVHLWKFDPARFRDANVVLDFCARLGIRMPPEAVRRFNDSLSREALSLLYVYRRLGPGYGTGTRAVRENMRLIDALRGIGSSRIHFAAALTQPILEAHRDDLRWMESRLGESLAEATGASAAAIQRLDDLLQVAPATLDALNQRLGRQPAATSSPEEVAALVHALRGKLSADWRYRLRRYLDTIRIPRLRPRGTTRPS